MRDDKNRRGDENILPPGDLLQADAVFIFREGGAVANFDSRHCESSSLDKILYTLLDCQVVKIVVTHAKRIERRHLRKRRLLLDEIVLHAGLPGGGEHALPVHLATADFRGGRAIIPG